MKYTIVVSKPVNVRSTYVKHGLRNELGGYSGTVDAYISLHRAVAIELRRLPADATEYDIEINGKITGHGF